MLMFFLLTNSAVYQNGNIAPLHNRLDLALGNTTGNIKLKCNGGVISATDLERGGVGLYLHSYSVLSVQGCYFEAFSHMAAYIESSSITFDGCYSNNTFTSDFQDLFVFVNSNINLALNKSFTCIAIDNCNIEADFNTIKYINGAYINDWTTAKYSYINGNPNKIEFIPIESSISDLKAPDISVYNAASFTLYNMTKTLSQSLSYYSNNKLTLTATTNTPSFKIICFSGSTINTPFSFSIAYRSTQVDSMAASFSIGTTQVADSMSIQSIKKYGDVYVATYSSVFTQTAVGGGGIIFTPIGLTSGNTIELVGFSFNKYENSFILPLFNLSSDDGIYAAGTFKKGHKIINSNVSSNGYAGWVCVDSGTPGTWKGFGLIQA